MSAVLAADVTIPTANAWVNGPSLTIDPGTWLLVGHATLIKAGTTICNWQARISTGTTHYASGQAVSVSNNPQGATIPLTAIVVLAAPTTVRIQATAATGAASQAMRAATSTNGSGNNATQLHAVKLA